MRSSQHIRNLNRIQNALKRSPPSVVVNVSSLKRPMLYDVIYYFDMRVVGVVETIKDEIIDRIIEKVYNDVRRKD